MDTKMYIIDSFRYLVSHVGLCDAYYTEHHGWSVSLNGRLYTQVQETRESPLFVFSQKTESGMVSVAFPKK